MYSGTGDGIPKKLEAAKLQARELEAVSQPGCGQATGHESSLKLPPSEGFKMCSKTEDKPGTELPRVFCVDGRKLLSTQRIETGQLSSDTPQNQSINTV